MVNKISKYSVFSTVDLKSAYHQIPLKEEDKQYTAFQSGNKLYQFTRLPFGVTNGTAAFQRIIDNIIAETEKLEATFGYVDNVTISVDMTKTIMMQTSNVFSVLLKNMAWHSTQTKAYSLLNRLPYWDTSSRMVTWNRILLDSNRLSTYQYPSIQPHKEVLWVFSPTTANRLKNSQRKSAP